VANIRINLNYNPPLCSGVISQGRSSLSLVGQAKTKCMLPKQSTSLNWDNDNGINS